MSKKDKKSAKKVFKKEKVSPSAKAIKKITKKKQSATVIVTSKVIKVIKKPKVIRLDGAKSKSKPTHTKKTTITLETKNSKVPYLKQVDHYTTIKKVKVGTPAKIEKKNKIKKFVPIKRVNKGKHSLEEFAKELKKLCTPQATIFEVLTKAKEINSYFSVQVIGSDKQAGCVAFEIYDLNEDRILRFPKKKGEFLAIKLR